MNDIEPHVPLGEMDPGRHDPGYWARFHARVIEAAGPALRRRAELSRITMGDVLLSWSRLLVPGTLVAAAAAGVLLLVPDLAEEPAPLLGFEEILHLEAARTDFPMHLTSLDALDGESVLVAVEGISGGPGW